MATAFEDDFIMERVDVIRVDGVDALAALVMAGSSGYSTQGGMWMFYPALI